MSDVDFLVSANSIDYTEHPNTPYLEEETTDEV